MLVIVMLGSDIQVAVEGAGEPNQHNERVCVHRLGPICTTSLYRLSSKNHYPTDLYIE